ncbi:serine hydrolase domain-containing protein [Streptomyces sp. NPDC054864]
MTHIPASRAKLPAQRDMTELLDKLAREYSVPGVQFAVYDRGAVWTHVYGEAAHGSGRALTPATLFPLGSTTKFLTATLLLQLVADGDLELDAPVGPLLPELAGDSSGLLYSATVRRLLSHTAGLPDMPGAEGDPGLRECVAASAGVRPVCEPGRMFSYSNLGYLLAGRVLESVTGMDWWEAARSFVLHPLAIEPGFLGGPAQGQTGQHAVHLPTSSITLVDEPGLPKALVPAGALMTSAADLLRLASVHLTDEGPEILEPELLAEMLRPVPGSQVFGLAEGWGLGLACYADGTGRPWAGHDGNTGGASCSLRMDPERGVAVALLTNATSGRQMGNRFFAELAALGWDIGRFQEPAPGQPLTGDALRAAADDVCGTYNPGPEALRVRWDAAEGLVMDRGMLGPMRVELHDGLAFRLQPLTPAAGGHVSDESLDLYCFIRDTRSGQVGGLYMSGGRIQAREGSGLLG